MSDRFEHDLRKLLTDRARVTDDDLEPLRASISRLPPRRARRPGWLAAAAGLMVMLGVGGLLLIRLPIEGPGVGPAVTEHGSVTPRVAVASPSTAAADEATSPAMEASPPGPISVPIPGEPSLPPQLDPAQCAALSFAPDRCLAIVEQARAQAGPWLDWSAIRAVDLATPVPDGVIRLGGGHIIADVTFKLVDGSAVAEHVDCVGLGQQYSLVCSDHPEIPLSMPYGPAGGYHDVPCGPVPGGEPGSACATTLPTIAPHAAAMAVPLEIAARDFPITTTGPMEIDVGSAVLPNGILSDARFSLADPSTRAFTVADGVRLEVRSKDPTRPPFDNAYEHGWYPGAEDVKVHLVLNVTSFTPGAQLQVRDLVVR